MSMRTPIENAVPLLQFAKKRRIEYRVLWDWIRACHQQTLGLWTVICLWEDFEMEQWWGVTKQRWKW
jgi:hypothetical protein